MAVVKLPSGNFQVRRRGSDGKIISSTYPSRRLAEKADAELKVKILGGAFVSNEMRHLTVAEYFEVWHRDSEGTKASAGWRSSQLQMYRDYIQPLIGAQRIQSVNSAMIVRVLQSVKRMGRSSQTVRHVFNLMHKVFRDAVETHEVLDRNPVKNRDKPELEEKEAPHLDAAEAKALLEHVRGKPYEVAVWLSIYAGLRIGEVQALLWENVDLQRGIIHVRRTYVRRERRFKEVPKGRKWHPVDMPVELHEILRHERAISASPYVAVGPSPRAEDGRPPLCYESYWAALKRYCRGAGIKEVATHSLRHSTASLWMGHGATAEDMKALFAHSDSKVTKRYIHHESSSLRKVANVIRLFDPDRPSDRGEKVAAEAACSTNVPCGDNLTLQVKRDVS